MPADIPGKPRASPRAGAPAGASRTPDQPRSVAEHRKVGTWPGVGWQERGGREGERGADACRTQWLPAPQSSKPVMEKRRRARINESLAQLQSLLLDALRKESSRRSKLEKADILELTVRHLQSLRRVQVTAALRSDPAILGKYRAGFHECLAEVNRFLAGCEGVPADVRSRLLGHLAACLARLGPARRPLPLAPATEALEPEIYAGRPPPPAFDGHCPLPRPGAALAPIFLPGLALAAPGAGAQGQGAPWRPWLR
ncbi:transcription factor HES-4 isoform X1 [Bubalus kerabau]|uniref:transcription factor HES-4 isoform X1 n=1 Tax=Bubalus bubalis TaxID=89462 RepID=UPI000DBC635D|nr:transcription factor HES-4 isoform X1 [Bubalus bubalis]XP_055438551.1 transcription factor HES-4 isoform X1 [Bubalus carabanensis]